MSEKAWKRERRLRESAIPLDRRKHDSAWLEPGFEAPRGDELIDLFWSSKVPGSGAPEIPYQEMVQAKANQGYDVHEAEKLLEQGLDVYETGDRDDLRAVTAALMAALYYAPLDKDHSYHSFQHPSTWEGVRAAMAVERQEPKSTWKSDFQEKILRGWIGQLAGGAFGTAIEGYTGEQIKKLYGTIEGYITEPETTNDDVVYELVLLDVMETKGRALTSQDIGLEWVRQIPFGWSAEWAALRNLSLGLMPPDSGAWHNPYSDWIGGQMRGMVCGMLAPTHPLEAARLAHTDGVVSHAKNGVYGEIYAAVLTSLSFETQNIKDLIRRGLPYLPQRSEYASVVQETLAVLSEEKDPENAWTRLDKRFERYNWIHAYPNIAADLFALWYGEGDFTKSMSLLAQAGNDVDCNAGLVGNILGVISSVPESWAEPIGDVLETYIPGKERLSIQSLAERTTRLAEKAWNS